MSDTFQLAKLSQATELLAQCKTVLEVKPIRDMAEAARHYAKVSGMGLEAQNYAAEIKLEAATRMGEILATSPKNKGTRGNIRGKSKSSGGTVTVPPDDDTPTLADIGISKKESSVCQAIYKIPTEVRKAYIAETTAEKKELTETGILEFIKVQRREARKQEAEAQKQEVLAKYDEVGEWDGELTFNSISMSSIHDLVLPLESIDMIFTDPPYHDEYIGLYDRLGEVAAHALKPGGYCMAYVGKMFIPEIIASLSKQLEYVSIFAVFQSFSQSRIMKHNIFENWRPILVFKKPGVSAVKEWAQDVVRGTRDKSHHEWQQDSEAPLQYIAAYTKPGDVVLDPFVGGGTTPWACKQLGRYFVAFDVNEDAVKLSMERVTNE